MTSPIIKRRESRNRLNFSHLSSPLQQVLACRELSHAGEIDFALKNLLPPQQLSHIDDAAAVLAEAVMANANVIIVGDFDVDGATSCALAIRCLRAFGLNNISYLVPNRFEFGYGLSPEIVGVAAMQQPDLIVTVDNGISSIEGVYAANELGISVLVTDHHLAGETLPTADVIVNPNLPGDRFSSKNLAGVGVIFYVMLALRANLRQRNWFQQAAIEEPNMSQFLDLVALGTVADVVPLDYNNRILVQQGLKRIRAGKACVGINALLLAGKRHFASVKSTDLGFAVGPRLNAAGRLEDMSVGIECLLTDNAQRADELAQQLDDINRQRRQVEADMQQEALKIVENSQLNTNEDAVIYTLYDANWHQGVVGLVASRIKERTHRPVLALAPAENGEWKGSARSVEGVHMRDLLARVDSLYPGLMTKFGGHAMAAGLSVSEENLAKLAQSLQTVAKEMTSDKDWQQVIWTDGELPAGDLTQTNIEQLQDLIPWGQGFPEPLFEGIFDVVDSRVVGDVHAKLRLQMADSEAMFDAIYFFCLEHHETLPSGQIHVVYQADINEFRERKSVQLIVRHIQ